MEELSSILKEIRMMIQRQPLKLTNSRILNFLQRIFCSFQPLDPSSLSIGQSMDVISVKFMLDIVVLWGIICRLSFQMDTSKFPAQIQKIIAIGRESMKGDEKCIREDNMGVISKSLNLLYEVYRHSKYFRVVLNEYYLSYMYIGMHEIEEYSALEKEDKIQLKLTDELFLTEVSEYYIYRNFLFLLLLNTGRNKFPVSFRKKVQNILSRTFLRPNGLRDLFKILLSEVKFRWTQYQGIIQTIVLNPPKFCIPKEYFKNICNQLMAIISSESYGWFLGEEEEGEGEEGDVTNDKKKKKKKTSQNQVKFQMIVYLTFSLLGTKCVKILRSEMYKSRFFSPLTSLTRPHLPRPDPIIFREDQVELPVLFLHGYMTLGRPPPLILFQIFEPLFDPFAIELFRFTSNSIFRLRSETEVLVKNFFSRISTKKGIDFLKRHLTYQFSQEKLESPSSSLLHAYFCSGESGGICISLDSEKSNRNGGKKAKIYEFIIDSIFSPSLFPSEKPNLNSSEKKVCEIENDDKFYISEFIVFLLDLVDELDEESEKLEPLMILGYMLSKYAVQLVANHHIFPLIHRILNKSFSFDDDDDAKTSDEEEDKERKELINKMMKDKKMKSSSSSSDLEMVSLAISLLHVTLESGELTLRDHHTELEKLLPSLRKVKERCESSGYSEISNLSSICEKLIAGGGYQFSKEEQEFRMGDEESNLQEEEEVSEKQKKKEFMSLMKEILVDLKDPNVPVRAYGMSQLRGLVREGKWKSLLGPSQVLRILNLFRFQLHSDDNFAYMSAIRGLEVMGDVFPSQVIPVLTRVYHGGDIEAVYRLKLGQSLIRVAQRCGEIIPKYAKWMVHSYLHCVKSHNVSKKEESEEEEDKEKEELKKKILERRREENALVRASALSNLSEVVELLRFGIFPYAQDIIDCVCSLMELDDDARVRRASILVISKFASGFSNGGENKEEDLFEAIKDHVGQICGALKKVVNYDRDEIAVENAKRTLDRISGMAGNVFVCGI